MSSEFSKKDFNLISAYQNQGTFPFTIFFSVKQKDFAGKLYLYRKFMLRWRHLAERAENLRKYAKISLVGKYTQLEDAYASVIKVIQNDIYTRILVSMLGRYCNKL